MSINIFWLSFLIVHWGFISFQLDYPLEGTLYPYTLKPYHHNAFSPFQIFHLCFSTIILFIWCYIPLTGSSILAAFVTVSPPPCLEPFPFFSLYLTPHHAIRTLSTSSPFNQMSAFITSSRNSSTWLQKWNVICSFYVIFHNWKKKSWNEMRWNGSSVGLLRQTLIKNTSYQHFQI